MILITGVAGFIGFHFANLLLQNGIEVTGIDNLNDYYEVSLKEARLALLQNYTHFKFKRLDLMDRAGLELLFKQHSFEKVIHLAAQAGVRYSVVNPYAYLDSNLTGFLNILECCRHYRVQHLVYASSSSVYGANLKQPFSEDQPTNHPLSFYGATKKANELMAHSYSSLYGLPTTGLRFFTVYGPWGRPDMALFSFTQKILKGEPIQIFNEGNMARDFTYISDIIEGLKRAVEQIAKPDPTWQGAAETSFAPYRLYNIGHGHPVQLMDYLHQIEESLGKKAIYERVPLQTGDVVSTCANVSLLEQDFHYHPQVSVKEGITQFVEWYRSYYKC